MSSSQLRVLLFPLLLISLSGRIVAEEARFVRGNSNADATVNLSDALYTLNLLFREGAAAACDDAADANDDGVLDISDAVTTLLFLFAGRAPPPAPFPGCGSDPTQDLLACASSQPHCVPVDVDEDGLTDAEEAALGTNPQVADTDGDGLNDGAEVHTHGTDPLDADTDDDGLVDGVEVIAHRTLPRDPDTDGDGYDDGVEVQSGTDPLDAASFPSAFPPDPSLVAPPVEAGVATSIFEATEFLYRGTPPIQTGVADGVILSNRVSVLRGRAIDRDDQPVSGVLITILGHPEFGQTRTRADGMFDMVVNGAPALVVSYESAAHLPAQRQIDAPWLQCRTLPDVVLIPLDTAATVVDLTGPAQVARGSEVTDADGSRRPTLLVPQGTTAQMELPGGGTQPLTRLTIRATEYSAGEKGPDAMPAALPATSGYTHCVDLTADEAIAAGATDVIFSSPLPYYVENFLDLPVGLEVPVGSYDRRRGAWISAPNGRVIKILGVTGALADLDVTGDGVADTGAALSALSITDAERSKLATLYAPGQSFWRALIPHFSPWDCNFIIAPPDDAELPQDDPEPDEPLDETCEQSGNSVIECQNQILGESIEVVGTGFGLHYRSDRTYGYLAANTVEIPLAGPGIPAKLTGIRLEIEVAGRTFKNRFPPLPSQMFPFTWDGRDAYGRRLEGPQPITARIGYVYPGMIARSTRFGLPGNGLVTSGPAAVAGRVEAILWRTWNGWVGGWRAPSAGLGTGWSLSQHHGYLPATRVLHRGDGRRESPGSLGPTIDTVGGGPEVASSGDGGPFRDARFGRPIGMAIGPDGSLYISDSLALSVRKVTPDGIIRRFAGGVAPQCVPPGLPCGNGGPALQASFSSVAGIAVGPDNSLYITENGSFRIRKVDSDGIISTFAGNTIRGFSGDGGPATQAQLDTPVCLAVGPDNSVYISDGPRIRRVGPDGIIDTVAGGGTCSAPPACGDGGPAVLALLSPLGIAVGRDGSLYIADAGRLRIRRVTPDGIIRTIAGTGGFGFSGDGGPATEATFRAPQGVAVSPDDTVYVLDAGNNRIRWFRPGGVIQTLAGNGVAVTAGDGGLATRASLSGLDFGIAVGPLGGVNFLQSGDIRGVRRVTPIGERFVGSELAVPSKDGSEVYMLALDGRHLRTLDALTGALRLQFAHDGGGRLASVTDADGNVTTIERDGEGRPLAIIGPFGHVTELELDEAGNLSRVTNPAGEAVGMTYRGGGLLSSFARPGGQVSSYEYDVVGRLVSATDPTGAKRTLERTGTNRDHTVTMTSPLGRVSTFHVVSSDSGGMSLANTDAAGARSTLVVSNDGRQNATFPDGMTMSLQLAPDPRWGMRAPVTASLTVKTPGGLTSTTTTQRTITLVSPADFLSLKTSTDSMTVNGVTFTTAYDGPTRTLTLIRPSGRRSSVVLDDRGRTVGRQVGDLEPASFVFDTRGRLGTIEWGLGPARRVTSFAYGPDGFLASITDPLGRTASFSRDALGRVTGQTLPDGRTQTFTYDPNGNVRGLNPPGRPEHTFNYTARDEVSAYNPPAVGVESSRVRLTYDRDRQPLRIDFSDGRAADFEYDAAGQLSLIDLVSGGLGYVYDGAGRLKTLTTPLVTLGYAHDGELLTGTTWSGAVAGNVTRAYDNFIRETSIRVNGSDPVAIQYDADDLTVQVGALVLTRSAQTDLVTATNLGASTDSTSYDGFGLEKSYTASHAGGAIYSALYTRDSPGRMTSKTETTGGVTRVFGYAYDLAGRLIEVRLDGVLIASYTYDSNGNRLSRTDASGTISGTYDAQDRLVQYGTAAYDHTPNGEREIESMGDATTIYQYDGLGNLTGAILQDGTEIEYVLDGHDRRIGKKVDGASVQGFLYQDRLRPVAELDGAGAVVSRFVYATKGNVPDYMVKGGITYRIISDHLGSPRLVIDAATGQIAQRMDHDEFGRVTLDTNPGFQPFGFAGGLYDRQTGLVHFGAREYDPETGRWTTKDPIGFAGGDANLYAYVANDPVNNVDPGGLIIDSCTSNPLCLTVMGMGMGAATQVQRVAQPVINTARRVGSAVVTAVRNVCRGITLPGTGPPAPPRAVVHDLPTYLQLPAYGARLKPAQRNFQILANRWNDLVWQLYEKIRTPDPHLGLDPQFEEKWDWAIREASRILGYIPGD